MDLVKRQMLGILQGRATHHFPRQTHGCLNRRLIVCTWIRRGQRSVDQLSHAGAMPATPPGERNKQACWRGPCFMSCCSSGLRQVSKPPPHGMVMVCDADKCYLFLAQDVRTAARLVILSRRQQILGSYSVLQISSLECGL